MQENELFQNTEAIANWTYPGATLYYKDCELKLIQKEAQPLFSGIRNLTGDTSELNVPEPIIFSNSGNDEKGGFWEKLFGK